MGDRVLRRASRGELRRLRVGHVDLAPVRRVERGWDVKEGPIPPKSRAGTRTVFLVEALRPLLEPLTRRWDDPDALVFGMTATTAFEPKNVARKANNAVKAENSRRAEAKQPPLETFTASTRHGTRSRRGLTPPGSARRAPTATWVTPLRGVAGRYRHLLPGQLAEDARRVNDTSQGRSPERSSR